MKSSGLINRRDEQLRPVRGRDGALPHRAQVLNGTSHEGASSAPPRPRQLHTPARLSGLLEPGGVPEACRQDA